MHLVWPFGHLQKCYMQFGAIKNREPPCLARLISPVFLFAVVGEERRRAKPIPYSHGHGNLNMAKKGPISLLRIDCIRGSSAAQKARGQQPCVCSVACGRYHACQQQKWASVGSKHPIGSCWSRRSGSWAVRACIRHGHEDGKKTQIWHQKQRQQPPYYLG